ncbi:MAG: TetR family transcriptional regulator [Rhizobiales bacterium]|nr:TetR family transcriptional regulator [Hyphomicrobiales bacterium]
MTKRNRSPAADVKREAIKTAAKQLFSTNGYVATTMRQIASAVSMESGSLYYHFSSKEELLSVLLSEGNESLTEGAKECLARNPDDPVMALREIIITHMRIVVEDRTRFIIATTDLNRLKSDRRKKIVAQRRNYEQIIENTIEQGIQAGLFRPCDVKVISYAIIAVANGVAFWFNPREELPLDEIARAQIALVLDGLVVPEARSQGQ